LQVINSLVTINIDGHKHDPKRVFLSEEKNDNVLDCIISRVKIVHVDPNVSVCVQNSVILVIAIMSHYTLFGSQMDPKSKAQLIQDCDLYYDMSYSVAYSTFANIPSGNIFFLVDRVRANQFLAQVRLHCYIILHFAPLCWLLLCSG
jgi:DNA (cytosine-5)-methyltransferase 1